jgi:glyoxylase-like metal-dependent hydrolase (beta-lactamase superfamily II)
VDASWSISTMSTHLPEATDGQPFIEVSALEAGFITLPRHLYVAGSKPDDKDLCPSLPFLLRHSTNGRNLLFDLGLGKDTTKYPPNSRRMIETDHPVSIPQDVVDSLRQGGLEPQDVEDVVISHLHFDQFSRLSTFSIAFSE